LTFRLYEVNVSVKLKNRVTIRSSVTAHFVTELQGRRNRGSRVSHTVCCPNFKLLPTPPL